MKNKVLKEKERKKGEKKKEERKKKRLKEREKETRKKTHIYDGAVVIGCVCLCWSAGQELGLG